jgi:dihydroorotase
VSDARFGRLTDAPASFTLIGARLVDPSTATEAVRDLAVRDGLIVAEPDPAAERIDARGLIVAPGLCDLHAHLRQPGDGSAEDVGSGSRAAAHGGFTTICAMPNTDPPLDTPDAVRHVLEAARDASCRVRVIGAATVGRGGALPADLEAMAAAGAVAFSDDGASVLDAADQVVARLAAIGLPLAEHAEDPDLAGAGVMRAGPTATRLGLAGWPGEAEVRIVERDIALAESSGAKLHLTHLSTAASVAAVRAAKERGASVTCDVTPHHLAMTDEWLAGSRRLAWDEAERGRNARLAFDGACRVNPPLGSREDALVLLAAVADGTIDAIATDHAPHPAERTLVPFEEAAPGMIGLETALSVGLAAVEARRLELGTLVAALSTRPAAIIGERRGLLTGDMADLVVFDPVARWTVERSAIASRSANTPLLGAELPGVVRLTVADGRVTYRS